MVEKSDVVEECSSCVRLQQEIEITRKDKAATLKMIKEKIMSTDKLIKKYQKKCDDFDKQAKQLNDLTAKHENCERNTEILQEQLSHSLEVTEPQKKTIKRLIQEKFVAEETILEWKRKNVELEEVVNRLKHDIQLRDEKDSSWKLEQQLQAKQIEKEKKRAEKLTRELEKAKEEIKQGKGLVKEQKRECRALERKCANFQFQVNKLKEELKYTRKNGGLLYQAKRKPSPRELNMTRSTRQSLKTCEEKLHELLSDSNQECKSPAENERPALTSIFDEMTNITDCPLSPVPPSPTESQDWSSESSDDHSDGCSTDSEDGSLGDLGDILELSLKNKNATSLEDETGENSSINGDTGGRLETEFGDEDTENNNESISAANDGENPENSEHIIQKENDKETMNDSYLQKEQSTPEKRQSEELVRKTSVPEDIDAKCQNTLSGTSDISSDEEASVATSKVPSQISTGDSTTENMDTNENALQVVGSKTTSIDKVSCESFDKESIEEVDIKNNNLSSTSLNKNVKDSLFVSDASENDDITKNCSESTTDISNHFRNETLQMEESGVIDNICGPVGEAVHKTSGEKLLSENNVKSLDLDKSEVSDEFKDDGVGKCADHTSRVLLGKSIDEENDTQDIPVTENIQHAENDALLAAECADHTSRILPGKSIDEENDTQDIPVTENIRHAENDALLSAECADHTSRILPGKSIDEGNDTQDIPVTENIRHAENDALLSAECADHTSRVLPGKSIDEGNDTQDIPVTENIQHAENDALLSAECADHTSRILPGKSIDEGNDTQDIPVTENIQHAENDALLSAECADHTSRELPGKSIDEGNDTQDIPVTENTRHEENDALLSAECADHTCRELPGKSIDEGNDTQDIPVTENIQHEENDALLSAECADHTCRELPGKSIDEENDTQDIPVTEHIQHEENDAPLSAECADHTSRELPGKSIDEENDTQDIPVTDNTRQAENDALLSAECADHTSRELPGKSIDEGNDTQDIPVTENIQHAKNDALLSAENKNTSKPTAYDSRSMENDLKDDDKDDSLPSNNNIKYILENIEKRLEDIPPEYLEHGIECDMDNNVDDQVGSVDKTQDNVSNEEKSSSTRISAHNLIVENSGDKVHRLEQTSKDTKSREKSITENAKISSLPNEDKVLELKNEVVRNNKRAKRKNPEESDVRRKRRKRVATPTNVNSTPTATIDDTLESIQKEHDKNPSATEKCVDEKDTLSTRILEHVSIYSNDNNTSSNKDDKSSVADNFAEKCHIDSTELSSELLNEEDNVALEGSKFESVDNKVVPHSSDLTKSYNKVDGDSPCYELSSITVMEEEGTEEILEEGVTSEVVDTNASVLGVVHDVLEHHSGERTVDFESFTLVDAVDFDLNDQNNPVDDIHQSDVTTIDPSIDKSKASISDPSIPSLSLSSVLDDRFHVFDVEMPILSPLPPSPSSSRKPSLFTSFPTLAALKPSFHSTSVGTSGVSLASFVSQASVTAKRHGPPAEYKDSEPLKKSKTFRQDTADDSGREQAKKRKVIKQMEKKLPVRPSFLTERQYADKVLVFLTREDADIDHVVSRLSSTKTMSRDRPIANALVEFQHSEDLMPTIIQKYHDRDRQHQEQSSRLAHLNNWTPVMSAFEDRVSLVVTRLSQVEYLKGLSAKVISMLSSAIIRSCSATAEPDKKCIASHCRLVCALCRSESNLHRMRVLCYDIMRSLYSRPGTVLYLMISIAGVWPAVLVSSASASATSKGFVCLAGESYLPLPCTIQIVLTTWARTYDWVLLGNVLDWLCAWKQVPSGVLALKQLAGELVRIMKDPSAAQMMHDKDGHPVLGFGLYEVIKALELVSCMLGWAWLNNVLVRGYLWDILTRWIKQMHPETKCSDVMTPCLDRSTSVTHNKEDQQRTNYGTGDTSSGIDVVQNCGRDSLSTSVNHNKEDRQRTDSNDTRNSKDVLHNDPQSGPPDQVPEPTVVAAIRLLGLVCRIAVQHYQKIPQVIPLLVGLLQSSRECPVPYAVQLASAYSLLEVSPWQPSRVLSALEEWKSVQDSQSKTLPASLMQGFVSLRLCLTLRKGDSST